MNPASWVDWPGPMFSVCSLQVAQSIDPAYTACWVGQALVAEVVCSDEAMDLFRFVLNCKKLFNFRTMGYA